MPIKKTRMTTTLALLKQRRACARGYKTLLESLPANYPQDQPINLLHILKSNGVQDMMWALRATEQNEPKVRVAICADMVARVLKHFEARYPDDKRPRDCINACRLFVRGKISLEALQRAAYAIYAIYTTVYAGAYAGAYTNVYASAYAAYAAADAAILTTSAADAADKAAYAAAADKGAYIAALGKERAAQARIIRKYLC